MLQSSLLLKFLPLRQEAPVYLAPEQRPAFSPTGEAMQVRQIRLNSEIEITVQRAKADAVGKVRRRPFAQGS